MATKTDSPPIVNGKQLRAALLQAQRNAQAVAKGSQNSFHKYAYAAAEHILVESKDALLAAGVEVHRGSYKLKDLAGSIVCEMSIEICHVESGESVSHSIEYFVIPDKGRPLDKALNSALTTSFAYFLRDLLLIPRLTQAEVKAISDAAAGEVCGRDDRSFDPAIQLATPEQVKELYELFKVAPIPTSQIERWWAKAGVRRWDDMPADIMSKCIAYVKEQMPANGDAVKPMAELAERF